MNWKLEIKTKDGDRHNVWFESKDDAQAEFEKLTPFINKATTVLVGGELALRGTDIVSAQVKNSATGVFAV